MDILLISYSIITLLMILILTIIIQKVSNKFVTKIQKLFTIFIWFFSFMPFFLIPIEINASLSNNSDPSLSNKPNGKYLDSLLILWKIYYYVNFTNGWLFLPFMIGYTYSGKFSINSKIKDAFLYNKLFFGFCFVIGVFSIFIFLITTDTEDIEFREITDLSLTIYNSFFYFIFLFALSYGLCKLPLKSIKKRNLKEVYYDRLWYFFSIQEKYEKNVQELNEMLYLYNYIKCHYREKFENELMQIKFLIKDVKKISESQINKSNALNDKNLQEIDGSLESLTIFFKKAKLLHFNYQVTRSVYFDLAFKCCYYDFLCHAVFADKFKSVVKSGFRERKYSDMIYEEVSDIVLVNYYSFLPRNFLFRTFPRVEFFFFKFFYKGFRIFCGAFLAVLSFGIFGLEMVAIIDKEKLKDFFIFVFRYIDNFFLSLVN